jgi:hypothetical protein
MQLALGREREDTSSKLMGTPSFTVSRMTDRTTPPSFARRAATSPPSVDTEMSRMDTSLGNSLWTTRSV